MANEKNLKPIRSSSEAREKGKKGGKKSGQVRRDKKTFKELAQTILELEPKNKELKAKGKAFGLDSPNNKELAVIGMMLSAINGNHNAFDRLLELANEKGQSSIDQEKKQADLLLAIEKAVKNNDNN